MLIPLSLAPAASVELRIAGAAHGGLACFSHGCCGRPRQPNVCVSRLISALTTAAHISFRVMAPSWHGHASCGEALSGAQRHLSGARGKSSFMNQCHFPVRPSLKPGPCLSCQSLCTCRDTSIRSCSPNQSLCRAADHDRRPWSTCRVSTPVSGPGSCRAR